MFLLQLLCSALGRKNLPVQSELRSTPCISHHSSIQTTPHHTIPYIVHIQIPLPSRYPNNSLQEVRRAVVNDLVENMISKKKSHYIVKPRLKNLKENFSDRYRS